MAIRATGRDVVSVDFTKDGKLKRSLRSFAHRNDYSLSQLIRRACREWLAQANGKSPARA